jgi:hypothetical protein
LSKLAKASGKKKFGLWLSQFWSVLAVLGILFNFARDQNYGGLILVHLNFEGKAFSFA